MNLLNLEGMWQYIRAKFGDVTKDRGPVLFAHSIYRKKTLSFCSVMPSI